MHRLLIIPFLWSFAVFAQDCDDTPEINTRIVALADKKIKRKVGRGECWDLAKYVLDETGAKWDGLEVYGRLIDRSKECIYPGDIVQFERVKLEWSEGNMIYKEEMKHHTAIVYSVDADNEITLIHQNTGQHGRRVGTSKFKFDAMKKGKVMIYRPVEN